MASPIRLHWTSVALGLSVLLAAVLPAHEAHAKRRKRVEIRECAQEDLYRSRRMFKEAQEWKPRCDAALKEEAAKPDTQPLAAGPLPSRRPEARPQPDLRAQQQRAQAAQRAQQQQARQQWEAQRRAQAQAWQQQRAQQQQQALQQQQAQLARQRAAQQQIALQQAQQQAALQRARAQPPAAPPPAAPPPAPPPAAPAPAAPPAAQRTACFDAIQDKVAWDREGKLTRWQPGNIAKLCAGAEDSIAPALCFAEAMRRDANRQWPEAIAMCAGKR